MSAWLTAATTLGGMALDWIQGKREEAQHKRELKAAARKRQQQIIEQGLDHQAKWEIAQIEARDDLLRRISFAMLSAPVIGAFIVPGWIERAFSTALEAMPTWYAVLYVSVIGAVWGFRSLQAWRR